MNIKTSMRSLACALAMIPVLAFAHGGEDHSHDAEAKTNPGKALPVLVGSESPSRLPDGSVFLPKGSQNLLEVRTVLTSLGDVSQTVELKGRVKADPSAGGQVQAPQMGRIVANGVGLPALGQSVKAGQVLAWLEPVVGSVERGNQQAQLAQIRNELAQAERRVERYAQLEGSIPQKEIDAAVSELQALKQQKAALDGGLSARQPLVAPASGVLSNVAVVAGQVVDAKETIFTVVDPQRLIVEALAYDARLANNIASVSGTTE
ncbi:MAG TPA: efflux RND transporter periplasmic adaptor subunit, partial [Noviherbaspirillum sp.]|nr:efflux RND transporter periplasmic adaptor subunit [Noviherbaspirillum sp.]